jgi:hypothetical protein
MNKSGKAKVHVILTTSSHTPGQEGKCIHLFVGIHAGLPVHPTSEEANEYFSPLSLHQRMQEQTNTLTRPRVPLIVLAQQQQMQQQQEGAPVDSAYASPQAIRKSLSTITERTERTEVTSHWHPIHDMALKSTSAISSTTSYGQIIGEQSLVFPKMCRRIMMTRL